MLFFSNIFGQTYQPVVIENASWQVAYFMNNSIDPYGYKIQGDTMINGATYKKVYYLDLFPDEYTGPYYIEDKWLFGVIREDTTNKRVFAIVWQNYGNCTPGSEFLLYDFSSNVHDTITECISTIQPDFPFIIDSITTENIWGAQRNIFRTNAYGVEEMLIEGIGYSAGLFASPNHIPTILNWGIYLYKYSVGTDEECALISSIWDMERDHVKVYPNPASTILRMEVKETYHQNSITNIRLMNNIGQEIFSEIKIGSSVYQLEVEELKSGMYFLMVQMQSGQKYVTKIIKD